MVFQKAGTSNVHVWALGLSCETLGASKPPGLHRQPKNSKRAHLRAPVLQTNTTKIPREDTQIDKKSTNGGGSGNNKREGQGTTSAKFSLQGPAPWSPPLRGPPFWAPPFGVRFFLGLGPPFGPHHDTHTDPNWIGHNWSNQDGQNGTGQSRSLPL